MKILMLAICCVLAAASGVVGANAHSISEPTAEYVVTIEEVAPVAVSKSTVTPPKDASIDEERPSEEVEKSSEEVAEEAFPAVSEELTPEAEEDSFDELPAEIEDVPYVPFYDSYSAEYGSVIML